MTSNLETLTMFKQALHIANPPSDINRLKIAGEVFKKVIDADPNFAGGYAGVSYVRAFMAMWGHAAAPSTEAHNVLELAQNA